MQRGLDRRYLSLCPALVFSNAKSNKATQTLPSASEAAIGLAWAGLQGVTCPSHLGTWAL